MSALPRPDLPPGPQRDLVDALHDLHHRAGWPSLRTLANTAGCSHTTVSKAFSSPKLPPWGMLELLVEAMGGDAAELHRLWLSVGAADAGRAPTAAPSIAGRRTELAAVRGHLAEGEGLLVVTGEAGIGKTTLVRAALRGADGFVAVGHCLPLSTEVPLLPVADCLRSVRDANAAAFDEAVRACPPYVAESLAVLLPETAGGRDDTSHADSRHVLFTAVGAALRALASRGRLTVLLEDLHWADPPTRDLLEHLLGRGLPVPVLGTWRTEDDALSQPSADWFSRVRRLPAVETLHLGPLTIDETSEQLRLIGVAEPEAVGHIHGRSQGHPLFTEQLAAHTEGADGLPHLLADLLDRRLDHVSDTGWAVLRTLGVAERPLPPDQLGAASAVSPDELTTELRALRTRRLIDSSSDETVQLQHPLLADAIRRRLVPGESAGVHRALAEVLGASVEPSAAEVASHWRSGRDREKELEWRVRAARGSALVFEWGQEAEHWLRVLDLWPPGLEAVGNPPVTRPLVYLAACDALRESHQWSLAAAMSDAAEAELGEVDDSVRAELLIRAAEYRGDREGFGVGVELIDRALELYAELPATAGHVRALNYKRLLLIGLGQLEDAEVLARTAVETASAVGDPRLHRHQIASVAWIEGIEGRLTTMSELFELGRSLLPPGTDPVGDIRAAMMACDALVYNGSHLQDVEDAARPGFEAAQAWAIDNESYEILCASLATARLRAGRTEDAEALIGASSEQPPDPDRWHHHQLRAAADVHRGRLDAAAERIGFIVREVMVDDEIDLETLCVAADVEFWRGGVQPTLPRLLRDLDRCVDSSPVRAVLPTILAASRGVAEEVLAHRPGSSTARGLAGDLLSRAGARVRPGDAEDSHVRAHLATASAELARAGREDRARAWTELIPLWDTLGRPHHAAYCRWRASEVALAAGRRTGAQKLLRAAARDARSHRPLASAIATTAAYAPQT